jgi:hypothetical protein
MAEKKKDARVEDYRYDEKQKNIPPITISSCMERT